MSTADRRSPERRAARGWPSAPVAILVGVLAGARPVCAHPVAQGALDVDILTDRIAVRATVSTEEVLVAAVGSTREGASMLEMLRGHGAYLLAHVQLTADGHPLDGRVRGVPEAIEPRPTYELEYPVSGGPPARLTLHEDVLREQEFAPGNPWEASYVVRIARDGAPVIEGLPLSFREPLSVDCRRGAAETFGARWSERAEIALAFVRHGVRHILFGYDHLLFVTALVLAVANVWELVGVISAFTLAHTLTLTLATLDLVRLPTAVVEPMIAASIVIVAVQNVTWPRQSHGWNRSLVAFAFGLFHGLGFAGGLRDAMGGMPVERAALAIAAFSVGVEVGHQMVVLPAFGARRLLRAATDDAIHLDRLAQRYGSAAISVAGLVYFVAALRR
jgi:hydrogenase/urease accessory protein HupE